MLRVKSFLSLSFFVILASPLLMVSCASDEKNSDQAEGAFKIAEGFEKDDRLDEAIRRYNEVKNKYPYSKYATMAELQVAECYYKQESFPEAQVSYQTFKELHPKHAQIDYVTFRLGMSFFKQLPDTDDRDLTLAHSAILYFDEVLSQYPQSKQVEEAKTHKDEALKKLATKEKYIADFYFRKEQYDSALGRYEGLLKNYAGLGYDAEVLKKAVSCALRSGDLDRAKPLLARLRRDFANSQEAKEAQAEARGKGLK